MKLCISYVSEILSVKEWRDLENWVRGCSRGCPLKMAPFDRPLDDFILDGLCIALSGTFFELFDIEYYRDLENLG